VARLLPWVIVATLLCAVTASVLRLRGNISLAGPSVAAQVLEVAAGAALIVVAGSSARGLERWLLAGAGACWLMAEWASPAAPGAVALAVGLISSMLSLPLVLAARLHGPRAPVQPAALPEAAEPPRPLRPSRPAASTAAPVRAGPVGVLAARATGALLAVGVVLALAAAVLAGPAAAAAASPREAGCGDCPPDLIAAARNGALSSELTRRGGQFAIAAGLVAVLWLAVKLLAAPEGTLTRRQLLSSAVAGDVMVTAFAAAVAAGAAVTLLGGTADPRTYWWRAVASAALIGLAAAIALPQLRAVRAIRVVARMTVAVADDPGGSAVDTLRAALGDPGLGIAYPAPGGGWRDRRGQPVTLPGSGVTLVTDNGENVVALIHGGTARVDRGTVTGAIAAARILLDTERIEAGALARVNDLRLARRLAADAADNARAKLERDLHDGAQQRLVALRYALGLAAAHAARAHGSDLTAQLSDADAAAEQALADLRELAHGISSATLATEGLDGAVRTAAEHARGAVTIVELPSGRVPAHVERAVYRLVADCLREAGRSLDDGQASASRLSIAIRRRGPDVVVVLDCAPAVAARWPPPHVADRIAAADGQVQLTDYDGGRRLTAVLPCE
jgi:signal transduction histidine kinase